jgi:hypothetical protein
VRSKFRGWRGLASLKTHIPKRTGLHIEGLAQWAIQSNSSLRG